MPFKQSNFAKTQKAIKQMREAPIKKRQHQENLSGHFLRLDDYQAMYGQSAGGSRMYLQPEESTVGDANESRDNKMYSMTHSSIDATTNKQNYVTATSFGPTKQGSLLRNPHREAAVNTSSQA